MTNDAGVSPTSQVAFRPSAIARPPSIAVYGAAAFAVLLWGGTAVVTKIAVTAFDPLLVAVLRSVIAGIALTPFLIFAPVPKPRNLREFWLLLASAILGFVLFPILFAYGLRHTSASHTGLIMACQPVFTGSVAYAVERRWPARRWLLGCVVALFGEVTLVALRSGLPESGGFLGDLFILAAAFSASAGYVAGSHLSRGIGTWATTAWGNFLGGLIMLAPLVYWGGDVAWGRVGMEIWGSLLYLAIFSSILAYVAWYWALTKGGIARIGVAQFFSPLVTVVLAVAVLSEALTIPLIVSGLIIFAGVWLAQRR